ncbi:MAG: 5-oxoprolinase subunit PxpA [Opitutaceae bacterium]
MTKTITIDLNCDLGEGAGHDAELMPLITSANIACGAHAGDEATMRTTVELALKHGVAIGAHPGFADRENFGRREILLSPAALHELLTGQLAALARVGSLGHVKLHGALYNLAARDATVAKTVTEAVRATDPKLRLFALAGSELVRAGRAAGLRVAEEVFADRTYQRDGSLTPRSRPDAFITNETAAVVQVLRMVREGVVRATDGTDVAIKADTVCLHGDGAHAVMFARRLKRELTKAGIQLRQFNREGRE